MTDTPDPIPEAVVVEHAPPVVTPQRRSVVPMVLGGVVAAALGFGVAQVVPQGWPLAQVTGLQTQVAAQTATIDALKAQVAALAEAPAPQIDPTLTKRLTALEAAKPVDLTPRLDALEQQVAGLSVSPGGTVDGAALTQLQAQIDTLKSGGTAMDAAVAEAKAQLDSIKTDAEATAKAAAQRAALRQVQAALDSGAPFGSAVADLPGMPEALTALAQSGVPSLQDLRATYPAAARAALDAALRADTGASWTDRLGTFLRGQTGARSLTPREGTDPDAVLSRAEAAVGKGDLTTALTELATLPQAGRDAMAAWLTLAKTRQDAVAAVQALSATVGQ